LTSLGQEDLVHSQLEHVIDHSGKVLLEKSTGLLQARVCVHFYEPEAQIIINDEIVAKELIVALACLQLLPHTFQIKNDLMLHLRN